ncbi:hypothetical protein AB1Y20_023377 [Prymnesium parvum]|uniref:Methyltransferase-like protein 4 n=1 Tax=Prymnesium parvum TaxID=97485 RepID=A0AB34JEH2_PRYPA
MASASDASPHPITPSVAPLPPPSAPDRPPTIPPPLYVVLLDPLEQLRALDPQSPHVLSAALFPPLLSPRVRAARPRRGAGPPVENEEGLCAWVEAAHAALTSRHATFCAAWRLPPAASPPPPPPAAPAVPPLAALAHAQRYDAPPLRRAECSPGATLCPPLLFSSLLANPRPAPLAFTALGAQWLVPRDAAFCLAPLRRWRELAPLAPPDGYRLLLLDPPWRSRSVARKRNYATVGDETLLAQLPVPQLACAACCLIAVWITNSRHRFVLEVLLPSWGARRIATWYWLKLTSDGRFSTGADPRSPHRKPWEPLILAFIGRDPPRLPTRLALSSVPLTHSHKPALDALLRPAAPHLLQSGRSGELVEEHEAWQQLPKMELFARELRPHWHSVGDEALYFQHSGFYQSCHANSGHEDDRNNICAASRT